MPYLFFRNLKKQDLAS